MRDILSLRDAVHATLSYYDVLDFAPTLEEVVRDLYGWSAPIEEIEHVLHDDRNTSLRDGFVILEGRAHLIAQRIKSKEIEARLWRKVRRFHCLLSICPFVRMAAVCNSLAYGNVHEGSDIDLFIVAKSGRLHTARLFLKILTSLFGMRAHHHKTAGRFCLSFFVTGRALDLKPLALEFDPHLAYFVSHMVPLTGRSTYLAFLAANNHWTKMHFRRDLSPRLEIARDSILLRCVQYLIESILIPFDARLENFANNILKKRDHERRTKVSEKKAVVISKDVYKFHENDRRREVADEFQLRLINSSCSGVP